MNYTYEGILLEESKEDGGGYSLIFPDWDGATCGMTLEEIGYMGSDFLRCAISSSIVDGNVIPTPTFNNDAERVRSELSPNAIASRVFFTIDVTQESAEDYFAWMPVQSAAEILGVTAGRVRVMANSGVLPSIREHGKIYVSRAAVEERKAVGAKRGRPALKP